MWSGNEISLMKWDVFRITLILLLRKLVTMRHIRNYDILHIRVNWDLNEEYDAKKTYLIKLMNV